MCFGKVAIFRRERRWMRDNKGRETRGGEKQTVSERRQSVSLPYAVQPRDSHANSVFTRRRSDSLHLGNV